MTTLTTELQQAIRQANGEPVVVQDPVTHARYVIVPESAYDRIKSLIGDELPTKNEQLAYLSHMVKIAGWDDPELDVYNEMK